MSDITVVVGSYNRSAMLSRLLGELVKQSLSPQIIIVDDGTPSESWPLLLSEIVDKFIWTRHSGYQRVARFNEGMEAVTTRFAILLDDDQIPRSRQWAAAYYRSLLSCPIVRGLGLDSQGNAGEVPWWSTANLGIDVASWKMLGGLDPYYNGNYGYEDLDFGRRVVAAGIRWEWGSEDTACLHIGEPYSGDRDTSGRNTAYYNAKWGGT